MTTNMNRITISIPEDIEEEIQLLKKTTCFDRSYSDIYRELIRLGMEKMSAETKGREEK